VLSTVDFSETCAMPLGLDSSSRHRHNNGGDDQIDAASVSVPPARSVSATQTEDEDSVDSAIVVAHGNGHTGQFMNGASISSSQSFGNEGGLSITNKMLRNPKCFT